MGEKCHVSRKRWDFTERTTGTAKPLQVYNDFDQKMLSLYVLSLNCTDEYLKLLGLGVFFFFFFFQSYLFVGVLCGKKKNVCRKRCKVLIASLLESEDTALVLFERKVKQRQPRRGEKLQALSSAHAMGEVDCAKKMK